MAAFLGSPSSFLTHPLRKLHLSSPSSSSSQTPPPQPSSSSSRSQQQKQQEPPVWSPHPLVTPPAAASASSSSLPVVEPTKKQPKSSPESTDWIASSLTRRFGLRAGLAWVGFLAVAVISEQIKTRLEASQQEAATRKVTISTFMLPRDVEKEEEVLLPNGIKYHEMRMGGGASPRPGDLVVIDLKGRVQGSGEVFVDTFSEGKKPLALVMGSRPYTKGMCEGVESVLRTMMKAGGKARVTIPPSLGFGEKGADLGSGVQIPSSATLEFIIQVDKVSIAPA